MADQATVKKPNVEKMYNVKLSKDLGTKKKGETYLMYGGTVLGLQSSGYIESFEEKKEIKKEELSNK